MQYDEHHVLLVDDGKMRPNCTSADTLRTCFSRAVEYKLDFDAGTATLVWEFEYPVDGDGYDAGGDDDAGEAADDDDALGTLAREEEWDIFNTAGGSVAKMDNGYYFVAFNAAEVSEGTEGSHPTLAFEVTPKGHARSKVRLPRISVGCGSYRTLTSDSVYFESEESTLNATTTVMDDV